MPDGIQLIKPKHYKKAVLPNYKFLYYIHGQIGFRVILDAALGLNEIL